MNPFELFLQIASEYGFAGTAIGLAVLIGVFLLKRGGVVVTGNWARVANVVLAMILSGLDPTNPEASAGITAAIATIVSSLIYEAVKWLNDRTVKLKFDKEKIVTFSK